MAAAKTSASRDFTLPTKGYDAWQDHDLVFPSTIGTPQDAQSLLKRVFKRRLAKAGLPSAHASTHARRPDRANLVHDLSTPGAYISVRQQIAQQYEADFYAFFRLPRANRQQ